MTPLCPQTALKTHPRANTSAESKSPHSNQRKTPPNFENSVAAKMAMSSSPGMSDVSPVSPVTSSQAPVAPPVESSLKKVRVSTSDGRQVGGTLCGWMSVLFVPALATE